MQTLDAGSFKNLIMLLKNRVKLQKETSWSRNAFRLILFPCDAFFPLAIFQYLALILHKEYVCMKLNRSHVLVLKKCF